MADEKYRYYVTYMNNNYSPPLTNYLFYDGSIETQEHIDAVIDAIAKQEDGADRDYLIPLDWKRIS